MKKGGFLSSASQIEILNEETKPPSRRAWQVLMFLESTNRLFGLGPQSAKVLKALVLPVWGF